MSVPGEFAARGEVLDVFLPGWEEAVRFVFDFDEVNEIKRFDPVDQSSVGTLEEVTLHPLREVLWSPEERAHLSEEMAKMGEVRHRLEEYRDQLLQPDSDPGPYWAAAVLCDDQTILDSLHPEVRVVWIDRQRALAAFESYRKEFESVFCRRAF